jgi:FKBP-type peptidyl-prolyl cis-trans isomerase FklB
MNSYFLSSLALGLIASSVQAQDKPDLTNPKQRTSYAIGANIATSLKQQDMDIDSKALAAGIADTLAGKPALTQEELREALMKLQQELTAKAKAKGEKYADGSKNLKDGEAFLAENGKKEGVKSTASGLQYKVIKSGTGASPKKTDTVKVHYHGTLIDGTVFDSSVNRGEPVTFELDQVIPGWTEGLQLMKVGEKWQLFLPAKLAYGDRSPSPEIGPNSALVFEVELLGIEKPN